MGTGRKAPSIYMKRARCRVALKEYRKAVDDYSKEIESLPEFTPSSAMAYLYQQRASAHQNLGDYQEAIKDYSKVIELLPIRSHYESRGRLKYLIKDYKGACKDFDKAIELNTDQKISYYFRGLCKIQLGLEGCEDLEKAAQLGYDKARAAIKKHCTKK